MKRMLCAPLLLLASACGGGSAPALLAPLVPATIDIGTVASSTQTLFEIQIANPNAAPGRVDEVDRSVSIQILPGQLPLTVPGEGNAILKAAFTPGGAGPLDETLLVTYVASDASVSQWPVRVIGNVEVLGLHTAPASHDFGDVLPGGTASRTVTIHNDSVASSATVQGATTPDAAFAVAGSPFPLVLGPGESANVTLEYTGAAPGSFAGDVVFTAAGGVTASLAVQATTGGEEIIDFGTQTFGTSGLTGAMQQIGATGITNELTFDIAADAIGFFIEETTTSGSGGLGLLTGPDGTVYENDSLTGAYIWTGGEPFTAQVPNTDHANVQLVAGGGQYKLRLLGFGGVQSCTARVIVERRPASGTSVIGTLDLNVFLAQGIAPTAATAAGDTTLQAVLTAVDQIYAPIGIRIGQKAYYDVTNSAYDSVTSSEFGPLLQLSAAAADVRLNLFFVQAALPDVDPNILGVAAVLGGPKQNGLPVSGVMSEYSGSTASFLGLVAAHEIGHFLGLAHTQERSGAVDNIGDTAATGNYLMHWQATGGTNITNGQALVVRAHPHVGPALVVSGQPKPLAPFTLDEVLAPQGWCATCCQPHKGQDR